MNNTFINLYDYELPKDLIAETPLDHRENSKLLHININNNQRSERQFHNLLEILESGDLLILNNTSVIPARIHATKYTGGKLELLFYRKLSDRRCEAIFSSSRPPRLASILSVEGKSIFKVLKKNKNILTLESLLDIGIFRIFEKFGEIPLPKYIKRLPSENDKNKYQTVYAKSKGSVAAPTAGLHFTKDMIEKLTSKGVIIEYITLHISYNTFKPIVCDSYLDHDIGSEHISVADNVFSSINKAKSSNKRIIAVGTTVTRAIEFCFSNEIHQSYNGPVDLFIYPGYNFKAITCMITNFHLPQSSLLLLVSAFAGRNKILEAYNYAVSKKYRFYSYGDSMFLENSNEI
tara:strand:- start:385 stop:1428 length:1044 start_codon:yes stop_codon:yes gene_type:complete